MEFMSSFREAVLNLLSAKLRSFLAILGVLVGTGSVVALISSSQLATSHALAQFKTLGTNLVSLYIRDDSYGQPETQAKEFVLSDMPTLIKSSPQIVLAAPYTIGFQSMYFDTANLNGQIIGTTENFKTIAKLDLARGRFVSYLDNRNFYCVIGATLAKKIEKSAVDPLGNQIRVGKEIFTIIGTLKHWNENLFISADINNSIIVPLKTSYLLNKDTRISNILVRLVQHPNIDLVKTQVTAMMHDVLPKKKNRF